MFLSLSIFVLVCVVIPEVAPDGCDDLEQCLVDLGNGDNATNEWLFMPGLPAHSQWINYINGTCNNWRDRYECNTAARRENCSNHSHRRIAHLARLKARNLCSTRGRQFFERIYTEAPQCVGNITWTGEELNITQTCLTEEGLEFDTFKGDCAKVTAARDCHRERVGERCGDLWRWLSDKQWDSYFEVFHPNCNPRPSQFSWPSG